MSTCSDQTIRISIGGCGCGCGSQPPTTPPGGEDLPPNDLPEIPSPDDDIGLLWKCNMSHYITYLWRWWGMVVTGNQTTRTIDEVAAAYIGLDVPVPSYFYRWTNVTAAILNMGGIDDLPAVYDGLYEQIVCAIYRAPTAAAALDNLRLLCSTNLSVFGNGLAYLANLLPIVTAFTPQDNFSNLPPSYRSRDCSMCTTPTPPGSFWYFVPGIIGTPYPSVTSPNAATMTLDGTAVASSITDLSCAATFDAYNTLAKVTAAGLTAVAFTVGENSASPGYSPVDAQNGLFYGGNIGHRTNLAEISGATVLIQAVAQPDAGDFDHVFNVDAEGLASNFQFAKFEYTPDNTTILVEITSFEARTT